MTNSEILMIEIYLNQSIKYIDKFIIKNYVLTLKNIEDKINELDFKQKIKASNDNKISTIILEKIIKKYKNANEENDIQMINNINELIKMEIDRLNKNLFILNNGYEQTISKEKKLEILKKYMSNNEIKKLEEKERNNFIISRNL